MRKEGTIVRWDEAKGFGFIRTGGSAQDVFVHFRDYANAGEAPRQGLRVTFDEIHVGGKGPRAVAVRPAASGAASRALHESARRTPPTRKQPARSAPRPSHSAWSLLPLMVVYALGLSWLVLQRQIPWWVLPASALLNMGTYLAYWQDKEAAKNGRWRIKEETLHLWSLAGGWGGAWFAQQVLRHKSAKASFRTAYWLTVMAHCAAAVGIWWSLRGA